MKKRSLNIGLILSSLLGYLEWGEDQQQFIFQMEGEVLLKLVQDFGSVAHLLILLPLTGQLLLAVSIIRPTVSSILTYVGIACTGLLLLLIFAIGIMEINGKMILSTTPFVLLSIYTIGYHIG